MLRGLTIQKAVLLHSLLGLLLIACGGNKTEENNNAGPSAFPVEVASPVVKKIKEWDEFTGRFEASKRVEVRARVSGYITNINFRDGEMVKKGDVLFVIDQRPFRIAFQEAQAALEESESALEQAKVNFTRVESLKETGAISMEEYDTRKQNLAAARAAVSMAGASVENAKLNLGFSTVRAPISGKVGRHLVNQGNLISGGSPDASLLTIIVDAQPIYFYFTGSESDFLKYSKIMKDNAGKLIGNEVKIRLQNEEEYNHVGKLDYMGNEIDNETGTIEGRVILPNSEGMLESGMFGQARLLGKVSEEVLMVPDHIIGTNQDLRFVYVVGADSIAQPVNIELGPLYDNGLRIIRSGLTQNDQVILNNIQKIRPGTPVSPSIGKIKETEKQ